MAAQSAGAKHGGKNLKDIHVLIGSLFLLIFSPMPSLIYEHSYMDVSSASIGLSNLLVMSTTDNISSETLMHVLSWGGGDNVKFCCIGSPRWLGILSYSL